MGSTQPFRLGFFSYLQGDEPLPEIYAQTLDLFQAADDLGFDTAWVAQHHFGFHGGLPSPFVFYSTLAERTKQIGVGTAIISLPLEDPVRLAEDAAVFEALHPGRLQLGLGSGFATADVLTTFGREGADKRALYDEGVLRFIDAIEGKPLNASGDVLLPEGKALRTRLWESPSTMERLRESSRRGTGLLLSRVAIGMGLTPTHEVQVPMVELYKQELPVGVAPRIGMSRTVYPSRDPESAYRNLAAGIEHGVKARAALNMPEDKLSIDDQFRHYNIHWGDPETVARSFATEPLFDQVTDLICQVQPGVPAFKQTLEAIELLATEVAPALGWVPVHKRALQPV